jgi:enoyl-CoA hydratase/carnithine racemase
MDRTFESLLTELDESGVLTVTFNRPESRNALTIQDLKDLSTLWLSLVDDDEVKAVIITGSGRAFCSGGDVRGMDEGTVDTTKIPLTSYGPGAFRNLIYVPQPVIAAVNGAAVGAGIHFPAIADFTLAADTARFGDPHVKVGLLALGSGFIIPSIGLRNAKQLFMTGDLVSADEALRMGLVNKVVPPDELMNESRALAVRLAAFPPEALRWTKKCMNQLFDVSLSVAWDTELALAAISGTTDSHKEAVRAFVESRPSSNAP